MALDFLEELSKNIRQFRQSESRVLPLGYTKFELMTILQRKANENAKLIEQNNEILENDLRPLLEDFENMSPDVCDELFDFTKKLTHSSEYIDMGLALEVSEALIKWARFYGNDAALVRSLYVAAYVYGMIHENMQRIGVYEYRDLSLGFLEEALAFKDKYFEIEDSEMRLNICRCLIWMCTAFVSEEKTDEAVKNFWDYVKNTLSFFEDQKVRDLDPDFPWSKILHTTHQNIINVLYWLRVENKSKAESAIAERAWKSYQYLSRPVKTDDAGAIWSRSRIGYTRIASMFAVGKIDAAEAIRQYTYIFYSADRSDYTAEGLFAMTYVPVALIQQIEESAPSDKSAMHEVKRIIDIVVEYLKKVPEDVDRQQFYRFVSVACKHYSLVLDFEQYLDMMINLSAYTHLYSYVHSVMTRELSGIIARYFFENDPENFIGTLGTKTVDEVLENEKKILNLILRGAICHDVCKVFYMGDITLIARRLYGFEFDLIKKHSNTAIVDRFDGENAEAIKDIIKGHHKWYDGTHGYYKDFDNTRSSNKFIIEIITIAEHLDAATDNIGRSYSVKKTPEQIFLEIAADAGTRYNPEIARAVTKKPELRAEIEACLNEKRKEIYYDAYLDICT